MKRTVRRNLILENFLYVTMMDIPVEHEEAFNYLYDNDHLVQMMKVPGNRRCDRYVLDWSDNGDMQRYLAVYEIGDPELPRSPAWQAQTRQGKWPTDMRQHVINRANGVFRQIFASGSEESATERENIYFLLEGISDENAARFDDLYSGEHIGHMLKTPGVFSCRRFRREWTLTGEIPDYLTIYAIRETGLPRSEVWQAQETKGAWSTEILPNFTSRRNGSYRRIAEGLPV